MVGEKKSISAPTQSYQLYSTNLPAKVCLPVQWGHDCYGINQITVRLNSTSDLKEEVIHA